MNNYILHILIAIDQLGNAVADGNSSVTISARTGYLSSESDGFGFWRFLEVLINFTFYPIEKEVNHCWRAYTSTCDKDIHQGKDWARVLLCIFVIPVCLLISVVAWPIYFINKLKS